MRRPLGILLVLVGCSTSEPAPSALPQEPSAAPLAKVESPIRVVFQPDGRVSVSGKTVGGLAFQNFYQDRVALDFATRHALLKALPAADHARLRELVAAHDSRNPQR